MEKRTGSCRLVYVGDDGDLYQSGRTLESQRLTWGWDESDSAGRLYYVWPSYSPDGSLVACFGVRPGDSPEAGLYAVAQDGVTMHEIWRMSSGAAPICESWSPDSSRIALLLQDDRGLRLELADINKPGQTTVLEAGSPLFWSWSPEQSYLAVHSGGSRSVYEDARLAIYETKDGCREVARLEPGEFRTPAWSPDGRRLAYVDASDGRTECLSIYRMDDGVSEIVHPVEGHSALLWSPDGRYLAHSQALGETPHMFTGVNLVDVRTGVSTVVCEDSVVGFFWSPCANKLVTISFNDEGGMEWSVMDVQGMRKTLDSRFYPTRELVYFCWFFDQFAASHPLISADGKSLVFAGHMADDNSEQLEGDSSVYVQSLIDDTPAQRLAGGHFACWDSSPR